MARTTRGSARLEDAARDFAAERFAEARVTLERLLAREPELLEARELLGLTYYRLGRWRDAIRQLEAFSAAAGTVEQNHVLADCHRALGEHARVADLWEELAATSPAGEVVTEGRIVAAGSLADQGDLHGALRLLRKGPIRPKRPKDSTVRLWYAIADLQERIGDLPAAREGFERVVAHRPDLADAKQRLDRLA